jgi:Fic family protein
MYNWQLTNWPNFEYNPALFDKEEQAFNALISKNSSIEDLLENSDQKESIINILVKEALKTSEIEGEMISRIDLISSIKKKLGYTTDVKVVKDKRSVGIALAIINSREQFKAELTASMMFGWHKDIFMHNTYIQVGKWRDHDEPMQIVSGAIGREKIHFEAPPSEKVPQEMQKFIQWFNASHPKNKNGIKNGLIRSAIAHLYYESIHPFEDGNGRIGRILAEKVLSQHINTPILMSLSSVIERDKKGYYDGFKKAQKSLQINAWIKYFAKVILDAQVEFYDLVRFTVRKTRLIDKIKPIIDTKQLKVILKMLDQENEEFVGGMNAKKYQSITKASKATATRDLADLVKKNILKSFGGGRSTNYQVNLEYDEY